MKPFATLFLILFFSQFALAEGNSHGGDDFRKTADEYQEMAKKYRGKGNSEIARLYSRMSDIKLDAAAKADNGHWDEIDWTEYFQIEEKIARLKSNKH